MGDKPVSALVGWAAKCRVSRKPITNFLGKYRVKLAGDKPQIENTIGMTLDENKLAALAILAAETTDIAVPETTLKDAQARLAAESA